MQGRRLGQRAARRRAELARERARSEARRFEAIVRRKSTLERIRGRFPERAQSMVEFALTLPVLMIFLLTAIDLGRVYIGYVNMQNMVRIAANFASSYAPDLDNGVTTVVTRYRSQVMSDAQNTGCALPTQPNGTKVPDPVYPSGTSVGGTARVTMTCNFHLIAPYWEWVGIFPGGNLAVTTSAEFPIRTGMAPTEVTKGQAPIADFDAYNSGGSPQHTFTLGQTVYFKDQSGNYPTMWSWCLDWNSTLNTCAPGADSTLQDPTYIYPAVGQYTVRLIASNLAGSSDPKVVEKFISINSATLVPSFVGSPLVQTWSPLTVSFTDTSTGSAPITGWAWTFGDGGTSTQKNPSHTYLTGGKYTVTLTITGGGQSASTTKVDYISVGTNAGLCQVPNFADTHRNNAQWLWNQAKFTGTLTDAPNAPKNGNYIIGYQSITGMSWVACSSSIVVSKVAP